MFSSGISQGMVWKPIPFPMAMTCRPAPSMQRATLLLIFLIACMFRPPHEKNPRKATQSTPQKAGVACSNASQGVTIYSYQYTRLSRFVNMAFIIKISRIFCCFRTITSYFRLRFW